MFKVNRIVNEYPANQISAFMCMYNCTCTKVFKHNVLMFIGLLMFAELSIIIQVFLIIFLFLFLCNECMYIMCIQ